MNFKGTLLLLLLMAAVIFTAQNYREIRVSFLFWSFSTSQAILIFSTLSAGVVIGWLTAKRRRGDSRPPASSKLK